MNSPSAFNSSTHVVASGMIEVGCETTLAALANNHLVDQWRTLLVRHHAAIAIFASPEWLQHLKNNDDIRVLTAYDPSGLLVGVLPIRRRTLRLRYDVANRSFAHVNLKVTEALGGESALTDNEAVFKPMLERALAEWPKTDALYIDALPCASALSRYLHSPAGAIDGTYAYSPFGLRPWHTVQLEPTFDDYLRRMSAKSRKNLRREVKKLENEGKLELFVCQNPSDVPKFLAGVAKVSQQTWQYRLLDPHLNDSQQAIQQYQPLAHNGLFRGYLLLCDERPLAFVVGYQYEGIYQYAEIGYDSSVALFSPGKVLLYMLIDDLHADGRFDLINFGVGDASYKRRFGTHSEFDESLLLVKRGIRNRAITGSHQTFLSGVELAKRLVGRSVKD